MRVERNSVHVEVDVDVDVGSITVLYCTVRLTGHWNVGWF